MIAEHIKAFKFPVAEACFTAIEEMLATATFRSTSRDDGGLIWAINLDGHRFELTLDRRGKVVASSAWGDE